MAIRGKFINDLAQTGENWPKRRGQRRMMRGAGHPAARWCGL